MISLADFEPLSVLIKYDLIELVVELLYRENLHASRVDAGVRTSFEFSHWMVEFQSRKLQIIIIYRPPYSSNHPVTTSVFFADFSNFFGGYHNVICAVTDSWRF